MGLYVEAHIRTPIGLLWERTRDPGAHARWDLRFTEIRPLPRLPSEPERFTYRTRLIGPLEVSGTGVSAGERDRPDGTRTSALRFASDHPLSPIAEGRGYWRYIPDGDGVRFLTGYDYRPRRGRPARAADRLLVRPLMGWATAWSFDRLRLWCERDLTPESALRRAAAEAVLRSASALAALLVAPLPAAVAVCAAAALLPPLPSTPAARRCLRRPPDGRTAAPPALLGRLGRPKRPRQPEQPRRPERSDTT
ncbi:hypothetical protein O4J56_21195 [Nocardiopsis sp. RSe5-2]|uniref:SRPBCC family protein n=1 Tax=Nocardiopsis endophytica TaxID=3018445 RepID=A0ABT4U891_9ACTN|nr:hypothetical protein [Nocardiopsis endophytica]MDA2813175.1 hypothetical protein [Nocardiopsis endophytica]